MPVVQCNCKQSAKLFRLVYIAIDNFSEKLKKWRQYQKNGLSKDNYA